jgi:hypothetical protein
VCVHTNMSGRQYIGSAALGSPLTQTCAVTHICMYTAVSQAVRQAAKQAGTRMSAHSSQAGRQAGNHSIPLCVVYVWSSLCLLSPCAPTHTWKAGLLSASW